MYPHAPYDTKFGVNFLHGRKNELKSIKVMHLSMFWCMLTSIRERILFCFYLGLALNINLF